MRFRGVVAVSSSILVFYLLSWLLVIAVGFLYSEFAEIKSMGQIGLSLSLLGLVLYKTNAKHIDALQPTDGFLIVVLTWLIIAFVSALPIYVVFPDITWVDALLESVSGITTTGIEVVGGLEKWSYSMLWYRQQLEFVGGVGIIVMSMSLLSFHEGALLSIYHGEFGKDVRDLRMTPRIRGTARYVCIIYGGLWLACAIGHMCFGVPLFYALTESMATVSTGGFSLSSLYGMYDSIANQLIAIVFMVLGAIGLHTHYVVFFEKKIGVLFKQTEARWMLIGGAVLTVLYWFLWTDVPFVTVLFDVFAFITTTGFETTIHTSSPLIALSFVLLGLLGACAGSTAGGIKIVRLAVLIKEVRLYLMRMLYPNSISHVALDGQVLTSSFVNSVRGYIGLFLLTYIVSILVLVASGMPLYHSFYWVSSTITNVGATVGELNIGALTLFQKMFLSLVMLIGRVEITSFLVVCLPKYWR